MLPPLHQPDQAWTRLPFCRTLAHCLLELWIVTNFILLAIHIVVSATVKARPHANLNNTSFYLGSVQPICMNIEFSQRQRNFINVNCCRNPINTALLSVHLVIAYLCYDIFPQFLCILPINGVVADRLDISSVYSCSCSSELKTDYGLCVTLKNGLEASSWLLNWYILDVTFVFINDYSTVTHHYSCHFPIVLPIPPTSANENNLIFTFSFLMRILDLKH